MDLRSIQRMVPNLTDEHLKPNKLKMKVSIATQVFSSTCGLTMLQCVKRGTLPGDYNSTARFILFMNDLFDSVNGSDRQPSDSLKSAITPFSIHLEFWDYALVMLENMFFCRQNYWRAQQPIIRTEIRIDHSRIPGIYENGACR